MKISLTIPRKISSPINRDLGPWQFLEHCTEHCLYSSNKELVVPFQKAFPAFYRWKNGAVVFSRSLLCESIDKDVKALFIETRRERLKSAPYLRLKKRKTFFWKKLKFLKGGGGTLLDLLTYIPLQNIKKLEGGPFGDIKYFLKKKVAQCQKKSKGGPLRHVRYCRVR